MKQTLLFFALLFTLSAGAQQCYSISQVSYNPHSYDSGLTITYTSDDQYSLPYAIGFPFCFMGNTVSHFIVGSNGIVCFDTTLKLTYCPWTNTATIPSAIPSVPKNCIMAPWQDLQNITFSASHFNIASYGTAPYRLCVISFDSIPYYSCQTSKFTGQVVLHETSNNITINIKDKPICSNWNGGKATLGLHDANGGSAEVPSPSVNYNSTAWTSTSQAWSFSPYCNVCAGVGIDEPSTSPEKNLTIYPNPASDYISLSLKNADGRSRAEICDLSGRVIISEQIISATQQKIAVNELPSGFYFIRIRNHSGEISETGTFVKE